MLVLKVYEICSWWVLVLFIKSLIWFCSWWLWKIFFLVVRWFCYLDVFCGMKCIVKWINCLYVWMWNIVLKFCLESWVWVSSRWWKLLKCCCLNWKLLLWMNWLMCWLILKLNFCLMLLMNCVNKVVVLCIFYIVWKKFLRFVMIL